VHQHVQLQTGTSRRKSLGCKIWVINVNPRTDATRSSNACGLDGIGGGGSKVVTWC